MKCGLFGLGLIATLGLAAACGDDGDDDDDVAPIDAAQVADAAPVDATQADAGTAVLPETLPDPLPSGDIDVTVATYNLGLIETIYWAPARLPLLLAAVEQIDAEVLCLQEVWLEYTSPAEFAETLSETFPYSFWSWTADGAFGNGVLILSKHPLYRGRELWFEGDGGTFVDRIAFAVDVVTDDSYFHFMCTHFEAYNDTILLSEIDKVANWVEELGYQDDTTLLLGDMNVGPPTGCYYDTCEPESMAGYDRLLETWNDAAIGHAAADECTYCREFADPMQVIPEPIQLFDERIDACMTRNLGTSVSTDVQVILKDVVSYEAGGDTRMTQLSDHRGVRCVFGPDTGGGGM